MCRFSTGPSPGCGPPPGATAPAGAPAAPAAWRGRRRCRTATGGAARRYRSTPRRPDRPDRPPPGRWSPGWRDGGPRRSRMSAWNCMRKPSRLAPPSTFSWPRRHAGVRLHGVRPGRPALIGDGLLGGPDDVLPPGAPGQAHQRAPGVHVPVGGPQTGKGGHQIDARRCPAPCGRSTPRPGSRGRSAARPAATGSPRRPRRRSPPGRTAPLRPARRRWW